MNCKIGLIATALIALSAAQASAASTELYSVEFAGPTPLYRINQANGSHAVIGPTGTESLGDLTSDTRAGSETLWAVRIATNDLVTLSPATGGTIGTVPFSFVGGPANPGSMTSLAFDPVSGRLYGNTAVAFGAPADALYEINPATGVSNFVGNIATLAGPASNVFALGFTQTGRLFGVSDNTDQLLAIDHNTAAANVIATLQVGLAFDIASRPSDDVMFLVDSGTSDLWTVDVANGNLTNVGPYAPTEPNLVGLAFAPVPEPATCLLILSALPVVGYFARRRRR